MRLRAAAALAVPVLAAGLLSAPTAAAHTKLLTTDADPALVVSPLEIECNLSMDRPHYSKNTPGVIAKATFSCPSKAPGQNWYDIRMRIVGPCSSKLPADEGSWSDKSLYGCKGSKTASYGEVSVGSGGSTKRYVPATGSAGLANDSGYYRAVIRYSNNKGGVVSEKYSSDVRGPL